MPAEPTFPRAPFSGGAFQGNWAQTQDLYTWQQTETADNPYGQGQLDPYSTYNPGEGTTGTGGGGQGQYGIYGRLTQAERDRHAQSEARYKEGFDYGFYE